MPLSSSDSELLDAAARGDLGAVVRLAGSGAPIDDGPFGTRPLWLALRNRHEDVVAWLLDQGVETDYVVHEATYANDSSWDADSPLMLAASRGWLRIVKILLDAGADAALDDGGRASPLYLAVRHRQTAVARYLLLHGADPCFAPVRGRSLPGLAAEVDALAPLLDPDRPEELAFWQGLWRKARAWTARPRSLPADEALQLAALAVVTLDEALLRALAVDLSRAPLGLELPLVHAVETKDRRMVDLVLALGAPVDGRDASGMTALMHAARMQDAFHDHDVVGALLAAGADASLRDAAGRSAYDHARSVHRPDVLNALHLAQGEPLPDNVVSLDSRRPSGRRG